MEEVHSQYTFALRNYGRYASDRKRRGIAGQYTIRLDRFDQLPEDLLLEGQVFVYRLHYQVAFCQFVERTDAFDPGALTTIGQAGWLSGLLMQHLEAAVGGNLRH